MVPAHQRVKLSVFDLDRTLTVLPTYTPFLLFAAASRGRWRLLLAPLLLPVALLYAARLVTRATMKRAMHRLALGAAVSQQEATRLAEDFASHLVARGLHAGGLSLIAAERADGRRIILATAAQHFYAARVAQRLGVDDVLATPSRWRAGKLVPASDGENCYGAEKRARLESLLREAGIGRRQAHIRFYSDHHSDLPTFEFADEAIAVNPSPKLRAHAARRGWPVLDWRGGRG